VLLEAGRACWEEKLWDKGLEYWRRSADIFSRDDAQVEHYARAISNLGAALLHSSDPAERTRGEGEMLKAMNLKAMIGDLEGLANSHCTLALHYWRERRFERALAFMQKDIALSRAVGDEPALAVSLGNIAGLYAEMRQFSRARAAL